MSNKLVRKANEEKFIKRNEHRLSRVSKAHDRDINKTYGKWVAKEDIKRSFFIWKGRFSNSFKEKEIAQILKEQNLRFYREVSFDLIKRFDFYIPLIDLVIEYDGSQHFNDFNQIKNDQAKEHILNRLGVKLIRYNKTHNIETQLLHDLVHHPVLKIIQ